MSNRYRECDKIKSFIELLEKTLGPVKHRLNCQIFAEFLSMICLKIISLGGLIERSPNCHCKNIFIFGHFADMMILIAQFKF